MPTIEESSRKLLNDAYDEASEKLASIFQDLTAMGDEELSVLEKLSELIGSIGQIEPLTDYDEREIKAKTFRPLARACVIEHLRHLLRTGSLMGTSTEFMEVIDLPDFANLHNVSSEDATMALRCAGNFLLESALFEEPFSLLMEGHHYRVSRRNDCFQVRLIGPVDGTN